jgi:16S rRNA G966 N2-methylase RsmD
VRVIAGALKGRRLEPPTWEGLRPTSDKLRETLFNVLAARVAGARVLDGFAGTGALGIEALSRGAAHVTFVDHDPRATALVTANLARCGRSEGYRIVTGPVLRALVGLRADPDRQPFDVLLLDPPYASGATTRRASGRTASVRRHGATARERQSGNTPEPAGSRPLDAGQPRRAFLIDLLTAAAAAMHGDGILVLEHASAESAPEAAGPLRRTRELFSGDSALSFYAMMRGAPAGERDQPPPDQ